MNPFCIEIAGKTAEVHPLFESTRFYFRNYLTETPPDIIVTVTYEDLRQEQAALLEEALREGIRPRVFQDPFLERSFIQRCTAQALARWNILLFHGSAVAVDGRGYLFTADCGTGKSTHTRLWCQVFGGRAVMVNDDKPFLRLEDRQVLLCGSPWSGKHGLDTNITVPLQGICILERGRENRIQPLHPEEALPMLERQCGPGGEGLVEALSRRVPLWHLTCNREEAAAITAYQAMKPQEDSMDNRRTL